MTVDCHTWTAIFYLCFLMPDQLALVLQTSSLHSTHAALWLTQGLWLSVLCMSGYRNHSWQGASGGGWDRS